RRPQVDADSVGAQSRVEIPPRDRADLVPGAPDARRAGRGEAEMSVVARRLTLCAVATGALLSVAAPAPAAAATHTVVIDKMKYAPVPPLKVGDTVVFVNKDIFRHTVT